MKKRNQYTPEFKTKVVLEVLREEGTLNEIAARYEISPVILGRWKIEFLERVPDVFKKGPSATEKELKAEKERTAKLERKVGQLTYEVDWLKKNLKKLSIDVNERKACIELNNPSITVKRQAELLHINRTSVYRKPTLRVVSDSDIRIMHLIDEIHTKEPTWGYRTITTILRRDYDLNINRKKVRRMMRDMGRLTLDIERNETN